MNFVDPPIVHVPEVVWKRATPVSGPVMSLNVQPSTVKLFDAVHKLPLTNFTVWNVQPDKVMGHAVEPSAAGKDATNSAPAAFWLSVGS